MCVALVCMQSLARAASIFSNDLAVASLSLEELRQRCPNDGDRCHIYASRQFCYKQSDQVRERTEDTAKTRSFKTFYEKLWNGVCSCSCHEAADRRLEKCCHDVAMPKDCMKYCISRVDQDLVRRNGEKALCQCNNYSSSTWAHIRFVSRTSHRLCTASPKVST